MHVGMFVPGLSPDKAANGIVTYVRIMRDALLAAGHRVTVFDGSHVLRSDGALETLAPFNSLDRLARKVRQRFQSDPFNPLHFHEAIAAQIRRVHEEEPLDVIEIEESFGWSAHLTRKIPVVVRLHGPHFLGKDAVETEAVARSSTARIAAEAQGIAQADALTSPSARLLEATLARFPTSSTVVEVIPNPIEPVAPEYRWSQGQCDGRQMLCVGRFDLRKGADIVLAAFVAAARQDDNVRLVMAGPDTGIVDDRGVRTHFAQYRDTHVPADFHRRIDFRGPLPASEIIALRLQSVCAVVASRFENFAYSVAESMAIGAPTIVSDSFGNTEMIENGQSGLVVPTGDPAALADAVLEMLHNPDRAAAMGMAAYDRSREWLSPARVAGVTVDLYERAIALFGRSGRVAS